MSSAEVRWVLAFDVSCSACRRVSDAVFDACDGKLEVLPLAHFEVQQWRAVSVGSSAEWAPTLLRVQGAGDTAQAVRAWTGPGMAVALVRRLGVRSTVQVLRALGELRGRAGGQSSRSATMGRAQFLRLGAGVAVATGLLVKGVAPAWAESESPASAQAWVAANKGRLPMTYDEVVAHPMAYRQAIHQASTPAQRSRLWVEHVRRFRAAHPGLSGEQAAVVDRAERTAATVSVFEQGPGHTALPGLRDEAVRTFGPDQAAALLGTLGPAAAPASARRLPNCVCAVFDPMCGDHSCIGTPNTCVTSDGGCGTFWGYDCDGLCYG